MEITFSKSIAAIPGYFNDSSSKLIANSLSTLVSEDMFGILLYYQFFTGIQQHTTKMDG